MVYKYLGDRFTRNELKGVLCSSVLKNGKCIRGRNGNILILVDGKLVVVTGRRLRKPR